MPTNREILLNAWQSVIQEFSGFDTIFEDLSIYKTGVPRPNIPYFTIKLLSGPTKKGSFDSQIHVPNTDKFIVAGERQYTLSIKGFGEACLDALSDLQTQFDIPTYVERLTQDADIAIVDYGTITDVSELLETSIEKRWNMDVVFNTSVNYEFEPGVIETAHVEGKVKEDDGDEHDIEINIE